MTLTLALQPDEEARLVAAADARGVSTGTVIREALDQVLSVAPERPEHGDDSRPIWELILDNMKDVSEKEFATLPKDGASQHDHYLYGHPKRA